MSQPSREDRELSIELAQMMHFVTVELVKAGADADERSLELADKFIERCGFDLKDSDQLGYEMGEIVRYRLGEVFLLIGLEAVKEADL